MPNNKFIKSLQDNGYVVVPNVINVKEIKYIKEEIKIVLKEAFKSLNFKNIDINEYNDIDKLYTFLKHNSPALKRHCYDILGKLALLYDAVTKPIIKNIAKKYLNGSLIINSTQLRIDDDSDDRVLPWHQELEQMSLITLNVWMPLININNKTGGMAIIPESHKKGVQRHYLNKKYSNYYSLPKRCIDKDKIIALSLNKGDAIIFNSLLYHKSVKNAGKKIRWTIISRYNQLSTMPYIRSPKANIFMERNPNEKSPGHDFLTSYKKID